MIKFLKYFKNYKLLLVLPITAMFVGIGLDLFFPFLTKTLIDDVFIGDNSSILFPLLLGLLSIFLIRSVCVYTREFIFDYIGTNIMRDMKKDLFKHIQKMHFGFFDKKNTGDLMSRIDHDVENVWFTLGFALGLLIENIIYFVSASAVLFYLNWKLALISLVTTPLIAFLAIRLEKKIEKAFEEISDQVAKMNTTAQENISGVRLVKAFSREKHEIKKFLSLNEKNFKLHMKKTAIWGKYFPSIEFLGNVSIILIVVLGGSFVINERLTLGTLVAFTQYIWMLIWPMRMLGWLSNMISESKASINKIEDIKKEIPLINDGNEKAGSLDGHIIFNKVSFKYDGEKDYVLKNISLNAKPGSTIAIMGETGSGKSTLVNLLGRFYDATEGNIYIDGRDIKTMKLKDLRKELSYVFQDTFLFSETVAENVRLGNYNSTEEEIMNYCSKACAHDFIKDLNKGYSTIIGERGIGLSGGQKQRLTIARSLIKNSKVLIFDDATSALDMETEFQLLKNINEDSNEITTFIIGHRISAVKNADEIIYLKNGEIIERGTHEQLVSYEGKYYEIYKDQFKDFEGITEEDEVI